MKIKEHLAKYWISYLLGLFLALCFGLATITFQVSEYERAVVIRLGKPLPKIYEAGLHFKWFYPIDRIWKEDIRLRSFNGNAGEFEEMQTADGKTVIVAVSTIWQIADEIKFIERLNSVEGAEKELNSLLRSAKNIVVGRYQLRDLINLDVKDLKIKLAEQQMTQLVREQAEKYGISVIDVNFQHLGFPKEVADSVFERMRAERKRLADKYLGEGKGEADKIKAVADSQAAIIISDAQAQAKMIVAEADANAAKQYAIFQKSPDLAIFLRKLEALKSTMGDKTTIIFDTNSAPFDMLKKDSLQDLLKKSEKMQPIINQ